MTLMRALCQNSFNTFYLPDCVPSLCTLVGGEVVPEHLIRHGKQYKPPTALPYRNSTVPL